MKRTVMAAMLLMMSATAWGQAPRGGPMDVKARLKKFAPVRIEVGRGLLDARQRALVGELVAAARIMDELFLRQVWEGNARLRDELRAAGKRDAALLDHFRINAGPFDRIDHNAPFIEGVGKKPAGAAFYPADMTTEEFAAWIRRHPEDKEAFEGTFTVIRRDRGKLVAVPYSQEYGDWLTKAADHLRRASELTDNASLKKYLASRAEAFLTNDYFQSDVDWVRLQDHDIEVVIGPYEVYEDELLGFKAAFEAFITRVDPEESARLKEVARRLPELERNLPIPDEHKGIGRSLTSPIVVAQEIFTAGDANRGVQTIAFNLPNDEKVRRQEGSKKVMLKNVQRAKFDKILLPIARLVMRPEDVRNVDFGAFFSHVLLHEMSHGLGPGEITKGGKKTTVNRELRELSSTIEECKADALGAFNNLYLIDAGFHPAAMRKTLWPTYLAGMFRSVRFGINEAHGGGTAIQFNYISDKGGFVHDPKTGRFAVDPAKIEGAVRDLAHDLLMIEATGDYAAAKAFVQKYRVVRPELRAVLDRLADVPVDIRPIFAYRDER